MKTMKNATHIEGYLYEHKLTSKVSGPNTKTPGTTFINGTIDIAVDEQLTNIITVHFTYVTPNTSKGVNATYTVLENIRTGAFKTVMSGAGKEGAVKLRVDSAIGLNEFYTAGKDGKEELIVAKRNEGGFVHVVDVLDEDEDTHATFETDMLITGTKRVDANPETDTPEKMILKGAVFSFRKELLPVEYSVLNPMAMDYFESLEASQKNPVLTKVQGLQKSLTITKETTEEGAFGPAKVKKSSTTRKDWIVNWAAGTPYEWDTEGIMTVEELNQAISERETHLATVKQRNDEYRASKANKASAFATPAPEKANEAFNF